MCYLRALFKVSRYLNLLLNKFNLSLDFCGQPFLGLQLTLLVTDCFGQLLLVISAGIVEIGLVLQNILLQSF